MRVSGCGFLSGWVGFCSAGSIDLDLGGDGFSGWVQGFLGWLRWFPAMMHGNGQNQSPSVSEFLFRKGKTLKRVPKRLQTMSFFREPFLNSLR